MSEKKEQLLGMNASTAQHRLLKDILWMFVQTGGHVCFRCGESMTRETFSIEHKDSWMSAPDPAAAFFDLNNVAFSHHKCNISAAQRKEAEHGSRRRYEVYGCRCALCCAHQQLYRDKKKEGKTRPYTKSPGNRPALRTSES